jgi:hypothetical protein
MRQAGSETPGKAVFGHGQEDLRALDDPSEKSAEKQNEAPAGKGGDHEGWRVLFRIVLHAAMLPGSVED